VKSKVLSMACGIAAITVALSAGPAGAAPQGELDPSFAEHGRLLSHTSEGLDVQSVAQQADGKLLIAGTAPSRIFDPSIDGRAFAVLRLHADGSRDDSFGQDGLVLIDFPDSCYMSVSDVAVRPNGRIIVAGSVLTPCEFMGGHWRFALAQLDADGAIDTSFGNGGLVVPDLGANNAESFHALLLDDGRVIAAGWSELNGVRAPILARFNADGSLDATFGTGPIAGTTRIASINWHYDAPWMTMQADGKLVVCGARNSTIVGSHEAELVAVRVNADGTLDPAFGDDGVTLVATGRPLVGEISCQAMPDGTIVLAGLATLIHELHYEHSLEEIVFIRLTANGLQDMNNGTDGISTVLFGKVVRLAPIVLLSDGQLGVAGGLISMEQQPPRSGVLMFVARLDVDSGLLDPAFGDVGITVVDLGEGRARSGAIGVRLVQQSDDKLVAVGNTWVDGLGNRIAVVRVDPVGAGSAGFAGFAGEATLTAAGAEGPFEARATVRRTGGSTGTLSVDYQTVGASAQAPRDFAATSGTLTWTSGDVEAKVVRVPVTASATGQFDIVLSDSTGGLATSVVTVTVGGSTLQPLPPSGGGGGAGVGGAGGGGGAAGLWLLVSLVAFACVRGCIDRRRVRG
jgi:uncharacterized delta-60 repeat protein